jgi:phage regulator Rha-like protein
MPEHAPVLTHDSITRRIFEMRGQRVMLDADLATMYGVPTKRLNEAVGRNLTRFPDDFMFRLTPEEADSLRSQFATLKAGRGQHKKYLPRAFTEQGVAMLSSVLNSEQAVQVNIAIIRAFVWMRQAALAYREFADKVAELEEAVGKHDAAIGGIIETLREMILSPDKEKRRIGF